MSSVNCLLDRTLAMPRPDAANLRAISRRIFLGQYAGAIGGLALAHLLNAEECRAEEASGAIAAAPPNAGGKAKSVICLFQHGGPSQVDLFDPKPALDK